MKLMTDTSTTQKSEPFGVYVHWPFCAAKCPYCDFNSHVRHNGIEQKQFVEAYSHEIAHMAGLATGKTVTSIFFGGGTPSLMEVSTVESILNEIAKQWTISNEVEVSLEANPSSVEAKRFRGYRSAGVNRVSLGVQSLDDSQLRFLGRLHSAAEARQAISIAREIFPRMSFDMIYARPGQEVLQWERELSEAISLCADHLSLYQLTIEQGTPFFDLRKAGKLNPPKEELAAELYECTQEVTAAAGLPVYEISNHAVPGAECQHNLVYWRGQEYVGIGPGAHGRLVCDGRRHATATIRNPESWWQQAMVNGHGLEEFEMLSPEEHADELLVMGLRLVEGFDPGRCEFLYGRKLDTGQIAFLKNEGFIEQMDNGFIRATPDGFLVLDAVVADLAAVERHPS